MNNREEGGLKKTVAIRLNDHRARRANQTDSEWNKLDSRFLPMDADALSRQLWIEIVYRYALELARVKSFL